MKRILLTLFVLTTLASAETKWIEVQTPHFRVISNASEGRTKNAAIAFEQMRALLGIAFNKIRIDHGEDFVVLGAADEGTMKSLLPRYWEEKGHMKPAGIFFSGIDRDYAVVRLDYPGDYPTQTVYHEYVHKIIDSNMRHIPVWLNEGLAEFYANAQVMGSKTQVGKPSERMGYLRTQTLLPLKTLLTSGYGSPHYTKDDKVQRFYAEATALTHYLMFGPGMGSGKKMNEFLSALQAGKDQIESFESIFGPLKKNEEELDNYIRKFMFSVFEMNNPAGLKDVEVTVRKLEPSERDAELGWFHIRTGNTKVGQALIAASLKGQDNALAHEAFGLSLVDENKDVEAAAEFKKAFTLDPKRYRAAYYYAASDASLPRAERKKLFATALTLNPKFASALVAQSQLAIEDSDLASAQNFAYDAVKLEPMRAGYWTLLASILERRGDKKSAAKIAQVPVDDWKGPDRWEAAEVLARVDPSLKLPDANDELRTESQAVKVVSVDCKEVEKRHQMALAVRTSDNKDLKIESSQNFMIGIPDTLWWVGHVGTCNGRMNGLPAVVRYRKKQDSAELELVSIELRNPVLMPATEAAGSH